jgi:hydroxymethylpyrimidine/phosphomethylpyrimidine kinase
MTDTIPSDPTTDPKTYHRALTIAGSDSGGGAGIQADLKTFAALGCYGLSVITALTAQNTVAVTGIHPVPPAFVEQQIEAVLSDIGADAVKIGMLFSRDLIQAVAGQLRRHRPAAIVVDPVMMAQSGDRLLQDDAVDAVKTALLPLASILTPNIPEAEVLVGRRLSTAAAVDAAAVELAGMGCPAVLIKGGHGSGAMCADVLYDARTDRFLRLERPRLATRNNHGTGCTLSSAIAAHLALGLNLEAAVAGARDYIQQAIAAGAGYTLGRGHGPVHHFFRFWS